MKRDLATLAAEDHDLLVVGGGIYGAAAAREAALRGLRVALIERDDFGCGTSWNSLKTVHGGIRYLQTLDLARAVDSMRERRRLLRLAPHLVRPLAFALPTRGRGLASRPALAAALAAYNALGLRRNRGVARECRLPPARTLDRAEFERLAPGLVPPDCSGAALWTDAQLHSSERLVFEFALAAAEHGARVANHVEAVAWLHEGDRIRGVFARDTLSGEEFDVRARQVLNCTGPAAWDLLGRRSAVRAAPPPLGRAGNLVLRRELPGGMAVGLRARGACPAAGEQVLFLAPWRGRTLLGTVHLRLGDGEAAALGEAEIARLLEAVNRAAPALALEPTDVAVLHAGVQPLAGWHRRTGRALHAPDAILLDHGRRHHSAGLLTLVGVKFTEAGGAAVRAIDRVCAHVGLERPTPAAGGPLLPGGGFESWQGLCAELQRSTPRGAAAPDAESLEHLASCFGGRAPAVLALAREGAPAARLTPGSPVIGAQVLYAAREEMALTLGDALLRRTELGARGDLDEAALERAGALLAAELGWSPARLESERRAVRRAAAPTGDGR